MFLFAHWVSNNKFFDPHAGELYGKYEHLEKLAAYKVPPAPDDPPGTWMTGAQNHVGVFWTPGIAGMLGAIDYLEWVAGRPLRLRQSMRAIRAIGKSAGQR